MNQKIAIIAMLTGFLATDVVAQEASVDSETIRVGIIGLDTSHATAFTKAFNQAKPEDGMCNCRVVAAYPHGSKDIESSFSRIPKLTEDVKTLGVEIVDSIDSLLAKVDCVLLETNDGKLHLEQAVQVFRAGKPVFIDKPTGSDLTEVVAIFRAAKHYEALMFSSSSLRYSAGPQSIRNGKVGDVLGCDAFSPASLEKSHVDLFWYGIHGAEILFTCMKTGCETVSHRSTEDCEVAVGQWSDGRLGTLRGMRIGRTGFGGTAFGTKGTEPVGKFDGYKPLVVQIARFFRTRESPIAAAETIEIYAFMQAAFESKKRNGAAVPIKEVMDVANERANERLKGLLR